MYDYTNSFDASQAYAKLGFHLFPVHACENGLCSCGDANCGSIAKHPLTEHGSQDATRDEQRLKEFFTGAYALANIAVTCGNVSGIFVLDVDDNEALTQLEKEYEPLPQTWLVETSKGKHFYFRYDERLHEIKNAVKFAGSLDVRTNGGYVLLPPSIHASGKRYRWLVAPNACEIANVPNWLVDVIVKKEAKNVTPSPSHVLTIAKAKTETERLHAYLERTPPAISGQRGHDTTYSVCCRLVELFGLQTDNELLDALRKWNERCSPPWDEKELRHKLASARKNAKLVDANRQAREQLVAIRDDENDKEYPTLDVHAYHGFAGDYIRLIEPHTECDNASLLLTLLTAFGVAVGRSPYFVTDGIEQHANIYSVICGESSRSRKGTSLGRIKDLFSSVNVPRVSGLSSGEGLINAVRDVEAKRQDDGTFSVSAGVNDKRLWVTESEFARVLKVNKREGNTLSAVVRDAWDGGDLHTLTKASPLTATNTHIGITAHITQHELRITLPENETFNGYANRFLWAYVKRSKMLPHGGKHVDLTDWRKRLADIVAYASKIGEMTESDEAFALWNDVYPALTSDHENPLWNGITSRAEAQARRLSVLYALLDGSSTIERVHLEAALSVWRYCDDSARILFVPVQGKSLESRLRSLIRETPGIIRGELRHAVSHTIRTATFDKALSWLVSRNEIVSVPVSEGKHTSERFYPSACSVNVCNPITPTPLYEKDIRLVERGSWDGDGVRSTDTYTQHGTDGTGTVYVNENTLTDKEHRPTVPPSRGLEETSTLAELLTWKNENAVRFLRVGDGSVWVTNEYEPLITPAIRNAILSNQEIVSMFVETEIVPASTFDEKALDELVNDLRNIAKGISPNENVDVPADVFLAELLAMKDDAF